MRRIIWICCKTDFHFTPLLASWYLSGSRLPGFPYLNFCPTELWANKLGVTHHQVCGHLLSNGAIHHNKNSVSSHITQSDLEFPKFLCGSSRTWSTIPEALTHSSLNAANPPHVLSSLQGLLAIPGSSTGMQVYSNPRPFHVFFSHPALFLLK